MSTDINDFFIIKLSSKSYVQKKNENGIDLSIKIPKFNKINPITTRKQYSKDSKLGLFWLAGGGSYLINEKYLVLIKRSRYAYTNPEYLSLATGRSDSYEELLNPNLVIRELFEELAIFQNGNRILPKIRGSNLAISDQEILKISQKELKNLGMNTENIIWVPAILSNSINKDFLSLSCNKEIIKKTKCCIYISERSGDINLLYLIKINDLDLENTEIFDMETDEKNNSKLLKREIYLMDVSTKLLAYETFSLGKLRPITNSYTHDIKITEHASFMIKRIRNEI